MGCHFLLQCYESESESEVSQSCPTLCNPVDCSPPGSSIHGIPQAKILELPFPSPGDLPNPGIEPGSPALQADALTSKPPGKPLQCYSYVQYYYWGKLGEGYTGALQYFFSSYESCCLVAKSCLTFWDPMDYSPPASSAHGISQARIVEWVAKSLSKKSSQARDSTCISCIGRWIFYCWAIREAPEKA